MVYLFSEILVALIIVALVSFALGWMIRGYKDKKPKFLDE